MAVVSKVRFGILQKVLLTLVFVSVTPLLAIWFLNYLAAAERIVSGAQREMRDRLAAVVSSVDGWVDMNARMLHQNAAMPDIQSMDADRQIPLLRMIARQYDWSYLVFTVDPSGQNIGRSDENQPAYYGDRIYVKQVLAGKPLGKQVVVSKTTGTPAFVLSVPIKSPEGGLKGVLGLAMSIDDISSRITRARLGSSGFAFLVDEEGRIISHPSAELAASRQNMADHPAVAAALLESRDRLEYRDDQGKEMLAQMGRTREGWLVVVQQDLDEVRSAIQENNRNALVLLGGTLVLVLLVSIVFSRRISVPILRLTEVADGLSRGRLDLVVEGRDRGDEIGLLANAIARLGTSIRLAMERLNHKGPGGA